MKLLRSRVAGFLLVAILAFAVVSLARSLWSGAGLWGIALEKVPEPKLDAVEPIRRADLQAARQAVNAELSQSGASVPQRAAAYGRLGKLYLAYKLWEPAAASLRNAGALDRHAFVWPYLLARALEECGQPDAARAAMTSALDRMAPDPQATAQDRLAARCFLGESAIRANRLDEARRHFEAALEDSPRAPFPLMRLGQLLVRTGERSLGAGYLERAAASLPASRDFRAWTAEQANAPPGPMPLPPFSYADRVYAAIRDLDRSSAGLVRLGDASAAQGKHRQALELFKQAMDADPGFLPARERHAEAMIAVGDAEQAARELEDVVQREPADRRARAALAVAYAAVPATRDKALALAREFRREPLKNQPLKNLVSVYVVSGRYDEALAVSRDGAAQYPNEVWPRLGEATMLAALGRHASARDAMEGTARSFPESAHVRLVLARFLVTSPDPSMRDPRRGLELGRQLLANGYSAARAETVAIALAAAGKFPAAVAAQKNAVARAEADLDTPTRDRLERVLRSLEAGKLWIELWPFRNAQFTE